MKKVFVIILFFAFAKSYTQEISPQTKVVDFKQINAALSFDYEAKEVSGQMGVVFKILEDADEVYLDGINMTIEDKTPDIEIIATDSQIMFKGDFKQGQNYTVIFDYKATPKQALYFVDSKGSPQIWTQGQGKYTSHWLPSLDDMNDKIEFDLAFIESTQKRIIASGLLDNSIGVATPNGHNMKHPISSYLAAVVIGDYNVKKETSASGIPLECYYYPQDSLKVEPTYRYSKQIFDFMEEEIGVPFPWQVYKQVPVKDFLYAGMENASCTVFSDSFVVDEIGFVDRNYINVNAHELTHQWFGDLVTETKSEHHWLHEGFATYYALLAEREIFGDDYFYYKLYETAEQLRELSDAGKGQKLVASGGSSLTYYQKGAWAVHILRELVGEEAFKRGVKSYLTRYAYQNVTTDHFMDEMAKFTSKDLSEFKKNWLYQSAFQAEDALQSLTKSDFMKQYFELQALRSIALSQKFNALADAIDSGNDYLGQEAVYQLASNPIQYTLPLYKKALASGNVFIRQAIAVSLESLSTDTVQILETLLEDSSYVTQQTVFMQLWFYYADMLNQNGVEGQLKILNKMESSFGFNDGNIRTLWLALALATPDYQAANKEKFYQELVSYTNASQPFQLRENAFQYLFQIQLYDETAIKNLIEACVHHNWRFRESARQILKTLIQNKDYKAALINIKDSASEKERAYISKILDI